MDKQKEGQKLKIIPEEGIPHSEDWMSEESFSVSSLVWIYCLEWCVNV